jgi:hypothetical protein
MTNDPVLIAYTVKDRPHRKPVWRRIGVAFPHDKGSGLTVLLDALPADGRIVLVEPKADLPRIGDLPARAGPPPALAEDGELEVNGSCCDRLQGGHVGRASRLALR